MTADELNSVLYHALVVLCILTGIPYFYIVICKSPPIMHLYRNTLLNLAFWYFLALSMVGVFMQPIHTMLGTKSCAKFVGIAGSLGVHANTIVIFLSVASCQNAGIAIIICFLYRYAQLRGGEDMSKWFTSIRGLLICAAVHLPTFLYSGIWIYLFASSSYTVEVKGYFHTCFDDDNYFMMTWLAATIAAIFLLESVIIVVLAILTIRALRSRKTALRKATYRVHLRLTLNLLILVLLPILFDVIPISVVCFCISVRSKCLYLVLSICDHMPFLDVFLSCAVTLGFITPYRRALKKLFA
ncbi:hypothetical protein QR680_016279 [Steinernema hermaphroditum]|uniref:Uncharacterized protein n=1 Tax=Steinernema hermaphroditum TaxID=289476 RepID=A0AA39HBT2_9BILA|nr:hypothetical protein QR680_016279 [Steinernema hermaphroditum]